MQQQIILVMWIFSYEAADKEAKTAVAQILNITDYMQDMTISNTITKIKINGKHNS